MTVGQHTPRRTASASGFPPGSKRRDRPKGIDSKAAKRAKKHAGDLGFLPAPDAGKTAESSTDQHSDPQERSSTGPSSFHHPFVVPTIADYL